MPTEGVLLSGLHSPPAGAGPLMMRASLSLMAPESGQARLEVERSRTFMLLHATWPGSPPQQF